MSATSRPRKLSPPYLRPALDSFTTPAWAIKAILPFLPGDKSRSILDAGAGTGAITECLISAGYENVCGVEIDPSAIELNPLCRRGDFLTGAFSAEMVVMNPPFSQAQAFVSRALQVTELVGYGYNYVFALLRLAFLEGQARASFHRDHPSDVRVLPKRPSFTGDGKTDSAAYAWFCWGPGMGGRWSVLECGK